MGKIALFLALCAIPAMSQYIPPAGGGSPAGAAGGDLSGNYPNPGVAKVNSVAYGSGPSTNTVPVVTGSNTVTYETVPNAALANPSATVGGATCTLGSSCTPAAGSPYVQLTGARGNPLSTLAYAINVTSGNLGVVGVGWFGGAATNASITDTLTTSWTRVVQLTGNANDNCAIFVGTFGSSGANTITLTLPASAGFNGIYDAEFTGYTTTSDGTANGEDTSLSITTTVANDLIIFLVDYPTNALPAGANNLWVPGLPLPQFTLNNDSGSFWFQTQVTAGKWFAPDLHSGTHTGACLAALKHS